MNIPEIDRLRLWSIVDNVADNLLQDEGPAKRRPRGKYKPGEGTLCAEHGLAWIIESLRGEERFALLSDFAMSPLVYLHNLELLLEDYGLDLRDIQALVLSHGHFDHFGGLRGLLENLRDRLPHDLSLYVGVDAFVRRWRQPPHGERIEMGQLDYEPIRTYGIKIIEVKTPHLLGGHGLLSGEIAREKSYEKNAPIWKMEKNDKEADDNFSGEQALVYHVRGKGLVVLTGCAHAGIVNTVQHARRITGIDKVHAIVGGFHLSGATAERITPAVEDLAAFEPDIVVPMHCTGNRAMHALDRRLPRRVIFNSTGTQYEFGAAVAS